MTPPDLIHGAGVGYLRQRSAVTGKQGETW
jgi:hypothetical protein